MGYFKMGVFALVIAAFLAACSSEMSDQATSPSFKDNGHVAAVTDKYLVEYAGQLAMATKTVTDCGGEIVSGLPELGLLLVTGLTDAELTKLQSSKGILSVVQNLQSKLVPSLQDAIKGEAIAAAGGGAAGAPQDAFFYYIYQWNMPLINAEQAWVVTKGNGVRVGILDTGGSPDHQDLTGKYDLSKCINFTDADPNDWQDRHFHGTHVAGTVAGNSIGVAAVAPDATLVAVKVLNDEGWGDDWMILTGILYAADPQGGNCDVINMSLGGFTPRAHWGRLMAMYQKAIAWANSKGCVVVCAAGNDAADMDHDKNGFWLPVGASRSIGVSATGPVNGVNGEQSSVFTNFGISNVDLAAPGGNLSYDGPWDPRKDFVLSCFAPYVAMQRGLANPLRRYAWAAGTSMAAPHVAGGAALVLAAKGGTPGAVEGRLQKTARDLGKPGADPYYGHGFLDVGAAVK